MCEIYGFSGNRKKELNNDLCKFYSHSDEYPNGWGLALFDEQKIDYDNNKILALYIKAIKI